MRRSVLVAALLIPAAALLVPAAAFAKAKAKPAAAHAKGPAPNARAISELAGKFKWGMTPNECIKIIGDDIHEKYVEPIKQSRDIYQQDLLRKKEADEIQAVKDSYVKFEGQKSGWDTSIIDKEFVQRNSESMLVMWEKDQRRFLFFWNAKLYKQYVAFNAEHPVFQGKSFDDFAKLIQNRYGQAEVKMTTMRTKDDATLDHLEWPAAGDFTLWAIDQSSFYGNFCLKLQQTSILASLDKARVEKTPKRGRGNAIIDAVTAPDTMKGDPNADVVDQIIGKKTTGEVPRDKAPAASATTSAPSSAPATTPHSETKKKPSSTSGSDDPLAGMKF
jgi:hypothetical protein